MKEKDELHRIQLIDRVAESDNAVAEDHKFKMEDNNTKQKKASYLKQFSNENKKVSRLAIRLSPCCSAVTCGVWGSQPNF